MNRWPKLLRRLPLKTSLKHKTVGSAHEVYSGIASDESRKQRIVMGRPALKATHVLLQRAGVRLVFKANIHQKFAVIDQKIVWYGSINLLSYGSAQESIMRLESPNIAQELIKILGNHEGIPDRP